MLDQRPGLLARYGVALFAVSLSIAVRVLITPVLGDQFPFATLLLAVLAAAVFGGFGPAAVAVAAGAVSAVVFLLPPRALTADGWDQQVGLALFMLTGAGVAAVGGVARTARLRAEAAAAAAHGQRELLEATLLGIGDGVVATDAGGRITFLNPMAEALTGWPQAAATGEPLERVFRIVNEETRKPVENPALRVLRDGRVAGLANHTILISKDGSERPIDDSAAPIRDERGRVGGAVLVFRDVTDRKRQEEGNRELLAVLESSTDLIGLAALDGSIRYFNDAGLRMLGLADAAEARTKTLFDFVVPDDLSRVREEMIPAVMRDGQWEGEWRYRNVRTGGVIPISKKVTLIRHPLTGEPVAFSTVSRDISDRKRAEADLRQSNARNAAILETALDAIVTCDHEGKVVEFNPAAERMFGYRRADVLGHDLGGLIVPPRLRAAHRSGMARFLATGVPSILGKRLELTAVRAGGAEFPVELAITPIKTDGLTLFTAHVRDISDRVRGERLRAARLAATQALAQARTAGDGIIGVLRAVGESLGWELGAFWTPDDTSEVLRCRESWRSPAPAFDEFEAASRRTKLARGEGLPGLVWACGKPQWLPDVTRAPNFPRGALAARDGLHGAVACPVAVGGQPLGVMEFFSRGVQEPDADLLEMLDTVAAQVGQFIERKAAEEALRRSERDLADFFENANVGLHWVGPDGTILRANKAELQLLGYAPEEYIGRSITEFHVDEPTICDILGRLKAGEQLHDYPARLRCKDGSIKDVLIHSSVLRASGEFVHTRCFTRDVTEQKRAEARLRDETQVTETLYRIGGTLAAELDLGRLLQALTDATTTLTEAGFGAFFYNATDDTGDSYLLYCLSGAPREAFERFPHPRATAVFEPTFKGTGTVRLDDVTADPRYGQNPPYHGMPEGHLPVRSYLAVPVKSRSGEVLGGLFFGHAAPARFTERHGRLVEGVAAQAAVAIDNARLFEQARRERERARVGERQARFLADASAALAALVDYQSTLQKVAALAVPGFADWAAVDVAQPDGTLRRLAVAHADAAKVQLALDLNRRYPPDPAAPFGAYHVLRTGEPEMMADIQDGMLANAAQDAEHLRVLRELGLKSYLCVPLAVRGKPLGVLTFVAAESGQRYDATDLTVARDLAHRAAVAVENAELYRELKEADRRKDEFLAMLAHELRNPLAPVRNGLQVLKMRADPDTVERARGMMERQVGHLVRMVDDLMDVSRIMRGKVELRKERVDLATVVVRAVETAQPAIDAAGHELTVSLPDESVWVSGDVVRLTQVLSNLLVNAAKYSERAGRVTVTVARVGAEAAVSVKDTGVGIAPADLSRVFELFAQVDRSISRSQGGLGIGLTLVKRLVELHGGTVIAHSEGIGRGSEFVVRLPALAESRAAVDGDADGLAAAGPRRRVLVVDDNVDAAESLAMLMRLADHEVRTAHDGPAGLSAAMEFRPDLIVLDIGLPGMSGYEVARRLREVPECRTTVLAAMTGWGQDEDRRRSREAGFDHHLVKPVDPAVLEELLASIRSKSDRGDRP